MELDYIENSSWPGNGDPRDLTRNGVSLTEAIAANYRLYGINIEFEVDDAIDPDNLDSRCKDTILGSSQYCTMFEPENGFNRYSLGRLETDYHDDERKLHMLYGSTLSNNSPKTLIDKETNYSEFAAQSWHTGAPDSPAVRYIEEDFGVFIGRDEYRTGDFAGLQSVTMHELGHALSVGWADGAPLRFLSRDVPVVGTRAYEVYSGTDNPNKAGGEDLTPEAIEIGGTKETEWSIMMSGTAEDARGISTPTSDIPVFLFSLEEVSTTDTEKVPSKSQ